MSYSAIPHARIAGQPFYQMTHRPILDANVVLIGVTETRNDHIRAVAKLLNTESTHQDLLLIEYGNRNQEIAYDSNRFRMLNLLKHHGFKNNQMRIESWDAADQYGSSLKEMFQHKKPLDFEILIGRRNESLVLAVKTNQTAYRKIFVLAGTAHFCVPPNDSINLADKAFTHLHAGHFYESLDVALKNLKVSILVPEDQDQLPSMGDLTFADHTYESLTLQKIKPWLQMALIACIAIYFFSKSSSLVLTNT